MDMTIPGFFKRIKIINVEPCPDFVFNTDLTVGMRELLVDCYDKLDSFEPRTAIALAKEINMFRRDRSVDKFIELCSQVANHFNNK